MMNKSIQLPTSSHHSSMSTGNTGYEVLIETLKSWGIELYTGVTGGGIIHFLKHISPYHTTTGEKPAFYCLGEYSAGFVPLGHYLASGKPAAAIATTGAATDLLLCGLIDAKLHDIPAVYLVPLCAGHSENKAPLQDTYASGTNLTARLQAGYPDNTFLLDDISTLTTQLAKAKCCLDNAKPVIFLVMHEILSEKVPSAPAKSLLTYPQQPVAAKQILSQFSTAVKGRRVTILVGEELARYPQASSLLTELSHAIKPAILWSINGANAAERDNPYGYGYLGFGGNDIARQHYLQLGEQDALLILGACPDEYTTNLANFTAGYTFFCTNIHQPYATVNNSYKHLADGNYCHIVMPPDEFIRQLLQQHQQEPFRNLTVPAAPSQLNTREPVSPAENHVNLIWLYQILDKWWPESSIGFDDVCQAYKDRQYVTQRPNQNIRFYTLYRGSAMGGAFGAAAGAKLAAPGAQVFAFTGDGCFRLFAGSLPEATDLGLTLFVLNNASFAIVEQGLTQILPDTDESRWHATVTPIDYCQIAQASGWLSARLAPDLSNIDEILNLSLNKTRSLLVEVPVDPRQIIGQNPRVANL